MPTEIDDETTASPTQTFLDRAYAYLLSGDTKEGMVLLADTLRKLKMKLESKEWDEYISDVCLRHPVAGLVHQDPFTGRAYRKPRGGIPLKK